MCFSCIFSSSLLLSSSSTHKRFYPQRPSRQAMPWSQVPSLLPPGTTCVFIFVVNTVQLPTFQPSCSVIVANSRSRAFPSSFSTQGKSRRAPVCTARDLSPPPFTFAGTRFTTYTHDLQRGPTPTITTEQVVLRNLLPHDMTRTRYTSKTATETNKLGNLENWAFG